MYTSVDFSSQITAWRWVTCPTNKGVSYILKLDYYYNFHPLLSSDHYFCLQVDLLFSEENRHACLDWMFWVQNCCFFYIFKENRHACLDWIFLEQNCCLFYFKSFFCSCPHLFIWSKSYVLSDWVRVMKNIELQKKWAWFYLFFCVLACPHHMLTGIFMSSATFFIAGTLYHVLSNKPAMVGQYITKAYTYMQNLYHMNIHHLHILSLAVLTNEEACFVLTNEEACFHTNTNTVSLKNISFFSLIHISYPHAHILITDIPPLGLSMHIQASGSQ